MKRRCLLINFSKVTLTFYNSKTWLSSKKCWKLFPAILSFTLNGTFWYENAPLLQWLAAVFLFLIVRHLGSFCSDPLYELCENTTIHEFFKRKGFLAPSGGPRTLQKIHVWRFSALWDKNFFGKKYGKTSLHASKILFDNANFKISVIPSLPTRITSSEKANLKFNSRKLKKKNKKKQNETIKCFFNTLFFCMYPMTSKLFRRKAKTSQ